MTLVGFHRVLISTGILFCAGFALWMYLAYSRTGSLGALVVSSLFVVAAVALGFYLRHLNRILGISAERK